MSAAGMAPAAPGTALWRRLCRVIVFPPLVFALGAILFADHLSLWAPDEVDLNNRLAPPMWFAGGTAAHVLGTDALGRDTLSRLVFGGRISLILAVAIVLLSAFIGTTFALVSGYYGGRLDAAMSRFVDSMLALPIIFIALLIAVILGPGLLNLVLAITLLMWARFARVIRGEVLRVKALDFVRRAQITGCSSFRIMWRHILPNVLNTIVVLSTIQIGWVIVAESSLSFLGVGVPPPTPSWGGQIADGREYMQSAWWLIAIPGFCITVVVAVATRLGDMLRDRLDPSLRNI